MSLKFKGKILKAAKQVRPARAGMSRSFFSGVKPGNSAPRASGASVRAWSPRLKEGPVRIT